MESEIHVNGVDQDIKHCKTKSETNIIDTDSEMDTELKITETDTGIGNKDTEHKVTEKNTKGKIVEFENGEKDIGDNCIDSIEKDTNQNALDEEDVPYNFLSSCFQDTDPPAAKVWSPLKSALPVVLQVVRVDKESGDNQAFSVCDGTGYLWNSCFLSRTEVSLYSVVRITEMVNVRDKEGGDEEGDLSLLASGSIFNEVLAVVELEVVKEGHEVGHCLWDLDSCRQLYVLASGALDIKEENGGLLSVLNNQCLWELTEESPEKCDVQFNFSNEYISVVNAHKNVLCEKSDVFKAHFEEGAGGYRDQEYVNLSDTNRRTFVKFLRWIYGFNIQFSNLQVIFDLLYLTTKYLITDFTDILRKKLSEHLSFLPRDVITVSNLNTTDDTKVLKLVFDTIDENIQLLCQTREFLRWDKDTLSLVLARESLLVDEWQLLTSLHTWLESQDPRLDVEEAEKLLELIKFEEISFPALRGLLPKFEGLVNLDRLEARVGLRLLRSQGRLGERGVLCSKNSGPFSSYRCLRHFSSHGEAEEKFYHPLVLPFQVQPGQLTGLPMLVAQDGRTLLQPNFSLKNEEDGVSCLQVFVRVTGAVEGLPDISVFRQADYFSHLTDITAKMSLHYLGKKDGRVTWCEEDQEMQQTRANMFRVRRGVGEGVTGCLVIWQRKHSLVYLCSVPAFTAYSGEHRRHSIILLSPEQESEEEGEDLREDEDDGEDTEDDDNSLDGFIVSEAQEDDDGNEGEKEEEREDLIEDEDDGEDNEDDNNSLDGFIVGEAEEEDDANEEEEDEDGGDVNGELSGSLQGSDTDGDEDKGKEDSSEEENHISKRKKHKKPLTKKRRRAFIESDSEDENSHAKKTKTLASSDEAKDASDKEKGGSYISCEDESVVYSTDEEMGDKEEEEGGNKFETENGAKFVSDEENVEPTFSPNSVEENKHNEEVEGNDGNEDEDDGGAKFSSEED